MDADVQAELLALRAGRIDTTGSFTLALGVTTTTVNRRGVSSNSIIVPRPTNAAAQGEPQLLIVPSRNQFVITHVNAGTTRTFDYFIINPLTV